MSFNREGARAAAQERIRDYEARVAQLNLKDANRVNAINQWQVSSDSKVRGNIVRQRFDELKSRREKDLDARRAKLASKLMQEDASLKQELIDSKEKPEERRTKLANRARQLASKRESERQALSRTLLDRAFDEGCDVLRETNSRRILYRTLEERTAQIEQKMAAKIVEEEEKRMFFEMNEQSRVHSLQRDVDDRRKQMELRENTVKILDQQVRAVNQRRADEAAARRQEIQELRTLWNGMAREQEEQDRAESERMKRLAAEVFEFNRLKQMTMSEKDRRERELDLRILQEALSREAEEERSEMAAKAKRMEDMKFYREQLAIMMAKEAESDAEREAMIQAAADAQQAREDADLAARDAARRRLMEEVDAIRQEQIFYKQQQRRQAHSTMEYERQLQAEADAVAAAAEARRQAEARKRNLLQKLELQTQIVAKAHMRAAEEDEKTRSLEQAALTETAYMGRVQESLSTTNPPQWFGVKKVNWYY